MTGTVLHLLYARFWHHVLYDLGYVSTKEPFKKLVNQGMILGEGGEKMSKSKKNVIDPGEIIELYGADTARWFMLSDSPPERDLEWTEKGVVSSYKFINKIWDLAEKSKSYKSTSKKSTI